MKIILRGNPGCGKTWFYLPEIIKILDFKEIFGIKTIPNNYDSISKSPFWKSIEWSDLEESNIINDKVLLFVDEPLFLDNEKQKELINNSSNVIMCFHPGLFLEFKGKWIENINDYLIIDVEYINLNSSDSIFLAIKDLNNIIDNFKKLKIHM